MDVKEEHLELGKQNELWAYTARRHILEVGVRNYCQDPSRSMECGGPVCRVALIQTGLASTYVLRPSKIQPGISDGVSTTELRTTDYGVRREHWGRREDFTQI